MLRRLAIFVDGFTLESATLLASAGGSSKFDVFDMLESLVAKSLVSFDARARGTRFRLLQTTREYGLAKLDEAGEREKCSRLHAETMLALAEQCWDETFRLPVRTWRARYLPELPNAGAAVNWFLGHEQVERAGRVLSGFAYTNPAAVSTYLSGHYAAVLAAGAADPRFLMAAAFAERTPEVAANMLRRASDGFAQAGDDRARIRALVELARRLSIENFPESERILASIGKPGKNGGDRYVQIRLAFARAMAATEKRDVATALDGYATAKRLARNDGDELTLDAIACTISEAYFAAGRVNDARRAVRAYVRPGFGRFESRLMALINGAAYAIAARAWREAVDYVRRAFAEIEHVRIWGLPEACAVQNAAALFAATGDLAKAARLYGSADALFAAFDARRENTERSIQELILEQLAGLPDRERATLQDEGAALTHDEILALIAALRPPPRRRPQPARLTPQDAANAEDA